MKKKIIIITLCIFSLIVFISCGGQEINNISSQKLDILRTDFKLSQEQLASKIKAEHLIKNQGYLDDDEVVILLNLENESLIETYNKLDNVIGSVSDYATTRDGIKKINQIKLQQDKVISTLLNKNLIDSVEYRYATITNSIAVKTTYKKFLEIEEMNLVKSVSLTDTFNKPLAQSDASSDASSIENPVDVYETGIYKSDCVSFTGKHTAVAVLDSGFDCSHPVFDHQIPDNEAMIKYEHIEEVIGNESFNASHSHYKGSTPLKVTDVFYNNKIPFKYDYADKDYDVFPYDSEHGTHVAGIIGGKDDVITGIAVDTQLVLLKVFPDLSEGGKTENILAALEDAVLIGVDAINMSLGSSCGFSREEDGSHINEIYDRINESGISLITAASNSYSSAFGGEQGNTNRVTNPDSGTVGSPSTYDASLSVASISGIKSKFIVANVDNKEKVMFFTESNSISGKPNDFYKELYDSLNLDYTKDLELEYVTVPGVGKEVNFATIGSLEGKIALIRRGDNTFEEKAKNAKNAGAVGCIIYNNIEGEILMSMGKSDHIPTISLSKELGTLLATQESGKLKFSYTKNVAGPFMSDFSSWGPTPSLGIKPEITAHGGEITSAVPGGEYDALSGTSMATPNLCGIVVLIRQYLKEKYPELETNTKQLSVLTNQLLMSTATIVRNQEGNPYAVRKQGAGLASIFNAVNTKAYLTVDGIDRPKLELGDDPERTGVYEMVFNVENLSNDKVKYGISLVGMTETVSTSDENFVAEKTKLLSDKFEVEVVSGGSISIIDNKPVLTVDANSKSKIKVVYKISDEDKTYLDNSFPYGMYVEGFVKLEDLNEDENKINLNIPFLAFYGDWTQAPIFDKTYYEVQSQAFDASIDEEDKIKADYFATTPYGSYFYNYIIPLGTYLYDLDTNNYDAIPANKDHIAISNYLGTIDGISAVYGGLLRGCKKMTFTITDKLTGEVIWEHIDMNANKAYSNGGSPYPYYEDIRIKSEKLGLINNRQYEFNMVGELDYKEGGLTTNARNNFAFDFYADDEAPILKNVEYTKEYDKSLKKDRYYLTMTIYDNHYAQSVYPILFTSNSTYTFLTDNPIPIYSERNSDTLVKIEITDYLEDIHNDSIVPNALAFAIDDYALNSNIYICQLPGTKGEFKFTKDGTPEGTDLIIHTVYEKEVVDLTEYLSTKDKTVDQDKDYLKYLVWTSSNEEIAKVNEGIVTCLKPGKVTITAEERLDGKKAILILNIKEKEKDNKSKESLERRNKQIVDDYEEATIESIRFSYFDTTFAYSRAAQTSEIGQTGSKTFISSLSGGVSMYPGEKIKLYYDLEPWYAEDNYELTFVSKNPSIATVDQEGNIMGLRKGSTLIELRVAGSNLVASLRITVKSEFVIENRTLIAYKGLGGDVVIPDDEGILYIGSYAFCLYDLDNSFELTEDDYDANKIPQSNGFIKSVVIPEGVENIEKYAFYKCGKLEKVVLPSTIRFIREFAFYNDECLKEINLNDVEVIGAYAFSGCKSLTLGDLDSENQLTKIYALGKNCFENCESLTDINLSGLRNTGANTFKGCTNLTNVVMNQNTKLSQGMFSKSGIKEIDIYETIEIPENCFSDCPNLETVNIKNSLVGIKKYAFSNCDSLKNVVFEGTVGYFGDFSFSGNEALEEFTLPNNEILLQKSVFYKSNSLAKIIFMENTYIKAIEGVCFEDTNLTSFEINPNNKFYKVANDGKYLVSYDEKTLVLAAYNANYEMLEISGYSKIGQSCFTGCNVKQLTILDQNIEIGDYAFADCNELTKVILVNDGNIKVGNHTFNYCKKLEEVVNFESIKNAGDYSFANTIIKNVTIASNSTYGEGAFYKANVEEVVIKQDSTLGLGCFQECRALTKVTLEGNATFGTGAFANAANLKEVNLENVLVIPDQCFYGCVNLKAINLDKCKEIGEYAFSDCATLNSILIPSVEVIKQGAFSRNATTLGAPVIIAIELPNSLVSIGDGAFLGCERLASIVIPDSVSEIGDYIFAFCLSLESVTLSSKVTRVGKYAFSGCEKLYRINLENITEIDEYAFTQCEVLGSISNLDFSKVEKIGDGAFAKTSLNGILIFPALKEIGEYAFQGAQETVFQAPKLEKIAEGAFHNNSNLKSFTFSSNLKEIAHFAFNGCSSLKEFTKEDSKNTGAINEYALLNEGVLYTYLSNNKLQLASVPQDLNVLELKVLEGTVRVDTYAGNNNPHIQKIILPESLEAIGNYAFYEYKNLHTVEFKSIKAPMLESSYAQNATLVETDPGYETLKNQFDIFDLYLCYYQFIDLVGKKEQISMIVPLNKDVSGYDAVVYAVYFKPSDVVSTHIAKEENLIIFEKAMETLASYEQIVISHDELVSKAVTALNAIKQNPLLFYTEENWNSLVETAKKYQDELYLIKINNANKKVKDANELLNKLPENYSNDVLDDLLKVKDALDSLTLDEKALLNLTRYNKLYEEYNESIQEKDPVVDPDPIKPTNGCNSSSAIMSLMQLIALFGPLMFTLRRRRGN